MKLKTTGWLFAAMLLAGSPQVFAQTWTATKAGTTVTNTATVSYEVGGVAQTAEDSDPDTFTVDRKIDVSVARVGGYANATSGAPATLTGGSALTFDVQNLTNDTMDILLLARNMAKDIVASTAANDTADISGGFSYFVDTAGGTANVWDAGDVAVTTAADGTSSYLDNMAPGEIRKIFVVGAIPAGLANEDTIGVSLTAFVRNAGAPGTPGAPGTMGGTPTVLGDSDANTMTGVAENVFADGTGGVDGVVDGARDGRYAAGGAYKILQAAVLVVKKSAILDDGLSASNPKAIPGATILYCITVTNSGGAQADSVELSDTIDGANASYVTGSVMVDTTQAIAVCDATTLTAYTGTLEGKTDASDTDTVKVVEGAAPANDDVVTVGLPDLAAGSGAATVVFKATIQE